MSLINWIKWLFIGSWLYMWLEIFKKYLLIFILENDLIMNVSLIFVAPLVVYTDCWVRNTFSAIRHSSVTSLLGLISLPRFFIDINGVGAVLDSDKTWRHSEHFVNFSNVFVTAPPMYWVVSIKYDTYGEFFKSIYKLVSSAVPATQVSSKWLEFFFFFCFV